MFHCRVYASHTIEKHYAPQSLHDAAVRAYHPASFAALTDAAVSCPIPFFPHNLPRLNGIIWG